MCAVFLFSKQFISDEGKFLCVGYTVFRGGSWMSEKSTHVDKQICWAD